MVMLRLINTIEALNSGCAFDSGAKNLFSVKVLFESGSMMVGICSSLNPTPTK